MNVCVYVVGVLLEVPLSSLREVVDARVLDEGGEDEGEAHEEEDVEGGRIGHLRNARSTRQTNGRRRQKGRNA